MSVSRTGTPWLFALNPATTHTLKDKYGGTHYARDQSPASLRVSVDNGASWMSAPITGIASGLNLALDRYTKIAGILPDGTVVMTFLTANQDANLTGFTMYGWRPGDASWHHIAPTMHEFLAGVTITTSNGQTTIWAFVSDVKSVFPVWIFACIV